MTVRTLERRRDVCAASRSQLDCHGRASWGKAAGAQKQRKAQARRPDEAWYWRTKVGVDARVLMRLLHSASYLLRKLSGTAEDRYEEIGREE